MDYYINFSGNSFLVPEETFIRLLEDLKSKWTIVEVESLFKEIDRNFYIVTGSDELVNFGFCEKID